MASEFTEMPRELQAALLEYTQARVTLLDVIRNVEDPVWRNCIQRLLDLPITVCTPREALELQASDASAPTA